MGSPPLPGGGVCDGGVPYGHDGRVPLARDGAQRPSFGRGGADAGDDAQEGYVVPVVGASGGIGVSSLCAMVSRVLCGDGRTGCVLVDADRDGGGLDVLVGVEHETGARWQDLRLDESLPDSRSLASRLPVWDGVRILSCGVGGGSLPDLRDIAEVSGGLALAGHGPVVVDCGRSYEMCGLMDGVALCRVVVCELTVPGISRAKRLLSHIRSRPLCLVGVRPHMARSSRVGVDVADAARYLEVEDDVAVAGPMPSSRRLCENMLSGLGFSAVDRSVRAVVRSVASFIHEIHECGGRGHEIRTS